MNIFIDESGSFVSATGRDLWSVIAAYMSPEKDRAELSEIVRKIRMTAGFGGQDEIKLKNLSEGAVVGLLNSLADLNGALFCVATDSGLNEAETVKAHQRQQAENIVEHRDKMRHESMKRDLQALSDTLAGLSRQLYIQLHCQVQLIDHVIREGVLYFVQRLPRSLGSFRWRIDQKNSDQTEYERAFVRVLPGFLQASSLREPQIMLSGADYSAYGRYDMKRPDYLEKEYGIKPTGDEGPSTNIGMLIREDLKFVNSKDSVGIQIADLLASALRRCLRGGFTDNELLAAKLGTLMVSTPLGKPPIQLLGFARSTRTSRDAGDRVRIMKKRARSMVI